MLGSMKKTISIAELEVGMYVNAIVKADVNLVVKSQGFVKSQATIDSLKSRGIVEIEIDLDKHYNDKTSVETPSPTKSSQTSHTKFYKKKEKSFDEQQRDLAAADKLYTQAREVHRDFIEELKSGQHPNFDTLSNVSQEIIDSAFENSDALTCLIMLKESNEYLIEHALNCAILLSIFAKHKNMSQAEIEDLTLSGLLMDCGMAVLPKDLVGSSNEYSEADHVLMRTHVDIGFEIAERFSDLPPMVFDIIQNHHERADGSGYPKGLKIDEITLYSQMAALVDCYDSMLTEKPYRSSKSSQEALEQLKESKQHDEQLINEFSQAIGLFPVGSLVHLNSDKLAIVIKRNKREPLRPIVISFYSITGKHHTETKMINLRTHPTTRIVNCVTPEEFGINLPDFFRNALLK